MEESATRSGEVPDLSDQHRRIRVAQVRQAGGVRPGGDARVGAAAPELSWLAEASITTTTPPTASSATSATSHTTREDDDALCLLLRRF
ncbi:MAG: hypothetical protein M5R40_27480 [Anaerolineae bacterium]|nr:hypothetical protein [Anaerolineae bacterium]